jgi:exosome complex RNA-binding protein Rrp42 (RNase PH superfamily)
VTAASLARSAPCGDYPNTPLRAPPQDAEAELSAALTASFASPSGGGGGALDWASLSVLPGRSAWALQLEALVTAADGAVLEALSIAAKAALADTALAQARAVPLLREHSANTIACDAD